MIKRDKLDAVFSDLVRERADWTCEYCGRNYSDRRQGLHCSHLFGRRHKSTRHHPDNAFAHCYGCHQRLGANPAVFVRWAESRLGLTRFEWLMERHQQIVTRTKAEQAELYQHLKSERKRILNMRAQGVTGRLEFVAYE